MVYINTCTCMNHVKIIFCLIMIEISIVTIDHNYDLYVIVYLIISLITYLDYLSFYSG